MRICMVTTSFPRWKGDGQGAFVFEMARAISHQDYQVRVIALHSPDAPTYDRIEDIDIIRPRYWIPERMELLKKEGGGLPITLQKYPLARLQLLSFFLIQTMAVARYALSSDIVHAHWTLSAAAACLGRWVHRCPILVTVQGSDIFRVVNHPVGAWLTRNVLSCCNGVTALSQSLKERVVTLGVEPQKVRIIPNGVDTTRFVPPPSESDRDNVILYVGSLIERKGVKHLLQALPDVFRHFQYYRLVLIGEGPQMRDLKKMAVDLNIEDRTIFLGPQPQEQVLNWMQRAKVLVLPSIEEGMGVVLIEAMACGTPVVASRVGGIQDVVTPDVGLLVPPRDSHAISIAIQTILNDNQWARMSQAARYRAVTLYDWNQIAKEFISIYNSLT